MKYLLHCAINISHARTITEYISYTQEWPPLFKGVGMLFSCYHTYFIN
jgi:hypothetical protein